MRSLWVAFQKPSATGNTFAPVWGRGGEGEGWDGVVSPAERTIFVLDRGGGSSSHKTDGTAQIRAGNATKRKSHWFHRLPQSFQSIPQSQLLNSRIGILSIWIALAMTVPHMLIVGLKINFFKNSVLLSQKLSSQTAEWQISFLWTKLLLSQITVNLVA